MFDTPINTDQQSLDRVLAQKKPVLLLLHDGTQGKPVDDALMKLARKYKGDLLVVRVNTKDNPAVYQRYQQPQLPAAIALQPNGKVKSTAESARPSDVRAHVAHLLHDKPLPTDTGKKHPPTNKPVNVTDANFNQEVLQSDLPVLVDFWAAWCGPCRMIAPFVEQMASEYAGKLKVAKLDTERNQRTTRRYQVSGIPTLILYKNGKQVDRVVGANPQSIRNLIQQGVR